MSRHDDLELELQTMGTAEVPAPDAAFLDALEQRILAADTTPTTVLPAAVVVPFARPRRKLAGAGVVAAAVAFAGVAAAAGAVVITRPFDDDPPATTVVTSTVPSTTTTVAPTTTVVATTEPATAPPTEPPTTVPATVPPTVAPTVPRTTTPPTAPATTTTEVKVPPSMTMECFVDAGKIRCRWSAGPDGTASYVILRSTLDPPSNTAIPVGPGDLTWVDPESPVGVTVGYLVHALDAAGKSLAHTPLVKATCC